MILLAQIVLVLIVLGLVLYPLYAHRGERAWKESRLESKLRGVAERKERLYGTVVDLDFDRDAGKISGEDHARMRDETMREVLAVLQEEQELGGRPGPARAATGGASGDDVERMIEEYKKKRVPAVEVTKA
jgi:hypothetical protein